MRKLLVLSAVLFANGLCFTEALADQLQTTPRSSLFQSPWNTRDSWFSEDPWERMERMHQQMQSMMDDVFSNTFMPGSLWDRGFDFGPSVEFFDQGDHYAWIVALPGIEKSELRVEVKDQRLMIALEQSAFTEEDSQVNQHYFAHRQHSAFQQSVGLPQDADVASMEMIQEEGRVVIHMQKVANE